MHSNCLVPGMAARTPSGAGAVGPAALVGTDAVFGVEDPEAAFGVVPAI